MKKNLALDSFDKYFGEITEPRKSRGRLHKLRDIMNANQELKLIDYQLVMFL